MAQTEKEMKQKTRSKGHWTLLGAVLLLGGLIIGVLQLRPAGSEPESPALPANPFSPEDFAVEDGLLTCTAAPVLHGIDVSSHQGQIDWQRVRQAGMEFAMIRLGYRGYSTGEIHADAMGRENYRKAGKAGLLRGVYFYSQATTPEEAREEADYVLELLGEETPELPVVFDWEYVSYDARTGSLSAQAMTDCALAFCQAIADAGLKPMLYFNQELVRTRLDLTAAADYPFWLAQYADALTYPLSVSLWQYTDCGSVDGISQPVDMDLLFLDDFPTISGSFGENSSELG